MIRCLIVDDSPTARLTLREILSQAKDVEVVGEAEDGEDALDKTLRLRPDVITMDVQMPRRDGFAAIREIMGRVPTPIVVICAGVDDATLGIGLKALQLGAVEVLEKPKAADPKKHLQQCEAIRMAVRAMKGVKVIGRPVAGGSKRISQPQQAVSCIGIVGSTGAPVLLRRIVEGLPKDFPVPILIVQHIVDSFCAGLAQWLTTHSSLPVRLAREGEQVIPGVVLVAPGDRHMMVSMGRIRLDDGPPVRSLKPSGNVLFASLAREYGEKAAGVILTGMGDDGASGLKLIRDRGGFTAAQGQMTSVVYGMPKVALDIGAARVSLEADEIVPALLELVGHKPAASTSTPSVKRRKLLLVDDTETILQIERIALTDMYDLVVARNGREALSAIAKHQPDGVVMDIKMPLMCGDEALREIRLKPEWKSLPVVMVTSETDPQLLGFCQQQGCQAILRKPIDVELLKGTVQKFVPP
jgi:two-component system, chemotaxis family, protein-glutamate methylesterase/glutaminase